MRTILMVAGFLFLGQVSFAQSEAIEPFDLRAQVDTYKQRYNLKDPDEKRVDNRGDGFEPLYGVRNLRVVLHGVYYRGGANNKYNKYHKRSNSNPLQDHGLENLCQEGFSESLYLYPTNYGSARKSTNCRNLSNADQNLKYRQVTGLSRDNQNELLQTVYEHIKGSRRGPLYAHCWNGWHASGFVAAISLRQFCGWSGPQAETYWIRNTDGNSSGFESIKKRIRDFRPNPAYEITASERSLICP